MHPDSTEGRRAGRTAWIDARAGVAGDMLLGALLDAGADLPVVRRDVEAVVPGSVALTASTARRSGMRATKLDVELLCPDQPHRRWADVRALLEGADLPARVRVDALRTFHLLARAEARVHGVDVDDVHFHEVGAWDSIADVVGVCSALADLAVGVMVASDIAVGDGFVRAAHGVVPVPVPAVLELVAAAGIGIRSRPDAATGSAAAEHVDETGELATPTGVALLAALAARHAPADPGRLPAGEVDAVGVGAGTKDGLPWPNVVRVALSPLPPAAAIGAASESSWAVGLASGAVGLTHERLLTLSANVDDLEPRAWPSVLDGLLAAGALDAWLTPILMKKGRPAHVVSALVPPQGEEAVRDHLFAATSTFGVRIERVDRYAVERSWVPLEVTVAHATREVRVKVGHRGGVIVRATPEYDDVAALAVDAGVSTIDALAAASAAAHAAGLVAGAVAP